MKKVSLFFIILLLTLSVLGCTAESRYTETIWLEEIEVNTVYAERVQTTTLNNVIFLDLPVCESNDDALESGLLPGQLYRTGGDPDLLCIVH